MPPAELIPVIPEATYVGSEQCSICHEDVFELYHQTVHAHIKPFESLNVQRGCESCHGPGSAHVRERGNIQKIIRFDSLTPAQSSAICLQCHARGHQLAWPSSQHALGAVACSTCHKSHKITAAKMLYKGEPELCYDCHQHMRAKAELPSHHPLREGKMKCTACHDTHGEEDDGLKTRTVNDLCYNCHADKQGPFVYEHAPVEEGCTLCHDSHGTIANNLLKQSEPFLCLRCHRGHNESEKPGRVRHPSMPALMTACTQCHGQIHGSDLPSQMGRGTLTR